MTGASAGIGRKISAQPATEGYFVFAGASRANDIAALSAIDIVQGIRLGEALAPGRWPDCKPPALV